ncbi:MAG: hypothetical protein ACKO9I_03230 [Sphaerospermopsis kisseleviana]
MGQKRQLITRMLRPYRSQESGGKTNNPITHYQLPITNYQLPITNHQSPITNHQLPNYNEIYRY